MYSLFFIAKNNIKKHRGEVAILFLLIYLAAVLLFCSLSLMLSGEAAIKASDEKYHYSDLLVFSTREMDEDIDGEVQKIANLPDTECAEAVPVINWNVDYYYGGKSPEESTSSQFYITDCTKPTQLNSFSEEFSDLKDNEIVIPYFLKASIKVGDTIHFKSGNRTIDFVVKGYLEHLYFATSMNVSGYYCLVSHDSYTMIENCVTPDLCGHFINCKAKEGVDIDDYDKAVQRVYEGTKTPTTIARPLMEYATLALSDITSALVAIFTVILVGLALIIMHFSIKNFIEMNIQNIGLLQATGYSAKALRFSCILEEMLICGMATLVAIGTGLLVTTPLNSLGCAMMGLSGYSGISLPALITTLVSIPLMVFLGTLLASRSYKKLTVLESLRSGIANHNFKKNHFALDKTNLPLDLALAGKQLFGTAKKTIFTALIFAVLAFACVDGFTLFQNFGLDQEPLLRLIGFETGDVQAVVYAHPEIVDELRKDSRVDRVLLQTTLMNVEITSATESKSVSVDVFDKPKELEYEYLLEGHLPEKENEIVMTVSNAKKLNVKVGDVVNIAPVAGGDSLAFTVCGIDQKINYSGNKALLSESGVLRIYPEHRYEQAIIYLKDGIAPRAFKDEWAAKYPTDAFMLVQDIIGTTIDSLVGAMCSICVIFVVLTCFVVILTEILLTRSQLIRERTELGVSKALGYTSGELVRRTILGTLPVAIIGVSIGALLHFAVSDKMMLIGLSSFGIEQSNLPTHPIWFLVTLIIIVSCAAITTYLNSRSISKLEPVRILKED
ncbi:MAG: FtsX-like permease family protein [Clostridiales bacterium]|nr:FtsX-like permease family protein [Clostridiales bacterium]